MVGNERESPGAQIVPSGVSIQNPQASSGLKMRVLAPGGCVLPGVVGGRNVHAHRSDGEALADVVTVRPEPSCFISEGIASSGTHGSPAPDLDRWARCSGRCRCA